MGTALKRPLRWWPAGLVAGAAIVAIVWIRSQQDWSFQERNLRTLGTGLGALVLLLIWWLALSRAPGRIRLISLIAVLGIAGGVFALFRIHGVSGDLRPILEPRWTHRPARTATPAAQRSADPVNWSRSDFSQFLGPNRNAELSAPMLESNWAAHAPSILWRGAVGTGWSGWAIVGSLAFTQEQLPEGECSTCYELGTGRRLWAHSEPVHYQNGLAGEGPRCTPTVASNRVFTLGATGILNCLDLNTGKSFWSRNLVADAQSRVPEWGFAGSPLIHDGKVIVSAGGTDDRSLLAYRVEDGELVWHAGRRSVSYGSPFLASLCGVQQILAFNSRFITAHEAISGKVLWEYPWGKGEPQVAAPVIIATNRVLFSSGYGVGSELLEVARDAKESWTAVRVWQSHRMKAKFSNLVQRQGFLYGLDDGILACIDLKDGSQPWKAGRYGHGQGLLVRNLYLLMAENGELVLLEPTPEAPHELARFRVFNAKTWNPIALAGELLLARNDREAACVRLPLSAVQRPNSTSASEINNVSP